MIDPASTDAEDMQMKQMLGDMAMMIHCGQPMMEMEDD